MSPVSLIEENIIPRDHSSLELGCLETDGSVV